MHLMNGQSTFVPTYVRMKQDTCVVTSPFRLTYHKFTSAVYNYIVGIFCSLYVDANLQNFATTQLCEIVLAQWHNVVDRYKLGQYNIILYHQSLSYKDIYLYKITTEYTSETTEYTSEIITI